MIRILIQKAILRLFLLLALQTLVGKLSTKQIIARWKKKDLTLRKYRIRRQLVHVRKRLRRLNFIVLIVRRTLSNIQNLFPVDVRQLTTDD